MSKDSFFVATLKKNFYKAITSDATPLKLSFSFSVGATIGMNFFSYGFHTILCIFMGMVLPFNLPAIVLGSTLAIFITVPFNIACYKVGLLLTSKGDMSDFVDFLSNTLNHNYKIAEFFNILFRDHFWPMLIGTIVMSIIFIPLVGFISYYPANYLKNKYIKLKPNA